MGGAEQCAGGETAIVDSTIAIVDSTMKGPIAYGCRNPDNQRLRARLATTRTGRGCCETKIKHG